MDGTVGSLLIAAVGVIISAILCLLPGLHIANVAGLSLLLLSVPGASFASESLGFLFLGMTTGYAILSTLPTIFFSAPDESTVFMVLPAQGYLLRGRGCEAALLSGLGGLGGVAVLAVLTPVAPVIFPALRAILQAHLHWILWGVIAYLLLSEWPKGSQRAPVGWPRWWDAWRNLTAGLVAFLLSGLLGFILLYRSPIPVAAAHQNLLPAFVGLFALPSIVQNLLSRVRIPGQHMVASLDVTPALVARGTLAGAMGGLFGAFFPAVTGGIAGLLTGHATAQRDDRVFMLSQGASKVVYYVGALLLFFVPRLHLTRGGMAWMLSTRWAPTGTLGADTLRVYYMAVAAVVCSGALSFLLLVPMARLTARVVAAVDYRWVSLAAMALLLAIVVVTTGWGGFLVCAVAVGIGLIPILWGARRSNCMGVLLLPLALSMVGWGSTIASWLGLI